MILAKKKKPTIEEMYHAWLIEKKELEEKVLSDGPEAASARAIIQYNTGYFKGYKDALNGIWALKEASNDKDN